MTTMLPAKICGNRNCQTPFWKRGHESHNQYEARRYCSINCSNQARRVRPLPATPAPTGPPIGDDARAARLIRPVHADVHDPQWRDNALCAGMDGEQFFPDGDSDRETRFAKVLCWGCPVRRDCLTWALAADADGIWGGTTTDERRAVRKRQGVP